MKAVARYADDLNLADFRVGDVLNVSVEAIRAVFPQAQKTEIVEGADFPFVFPDVRARLGQYDSQTKTFEMQVYERP